MYLEEYLEAVGRLFEQIRTTQIDAIKQAAAVIANSLANRGAVAVMDTGHMLKYEAFTRAGGLVALMPFGYAFSVEHTVEHREAAGTPEQEADVEARKVALALDAAKLKAGDVIVINSNSGRTANVIEVALQCKDRGITTIGISSREQMGKCDVAHVSGRKLFDVADVCIDNCGPHGDAMIPVKDNEKMCPASGLAATYIFWAVHAEVVERLQASGKNPTIFRSVHVGGRESIEEQRKQFREKGI